MGSLEVRNLLLSKKLKRSENRILIIDDNQIRYNQIVEIFKTNQHLVQMTLLDDLNSFEKQLNTAWDLVIFGRAYDIRIEQAAALIQTSFNADIPIIILTPDNYHYEQYISFIQKGVYEVVNLDYEDRFYISLARALSYSRTLQIQKNLLNDLENEKLKKIESVEEQNSAVAVIQEGIHIEANTEYLNLFGFKDQDEIIGLPLLDVIQPKSLTDFKSRFKKISQGQFEFGRFEVDTLNINAKNSNPLKIEFIAGQKEDTIQIIIEKENTNKIVASTNSTAPALLHYQDFFQKINRHLQNNPAKENAFIIYSLSSCPNDVLNSDWATFKGYFDNFSQFIKDQTLGSVFKIGNALYATLLQAESLDVLNSRLTGLSALAKPQLVNLGQQTYPLNIKIGFSLFKMEQLNEDFLQTLIEKAYNTHIPHHHVETELEFNIPDLKQYSAQETESTISLEQVPNFSIRESDHLSPKEPKLNIEAITFSHSPILAQIQKALDKNEIQLKYQQLYDKQDSNVNTYEVSSGFIYENTFKQLNNLTELDEDSELSIKVDRWILVEACKQLHNFITQYPHAKLIVNLNRHVLLHDPQLPALVSKLLTIVGSKLHHPLILQFDEDNIAKNLIESNKAIESLREHGAEIAIRHFGSGASSESILKQTDVNLLTLDPKLTNMLSNDKTMSKLQHMVEHYISIKPIEILLKGLNDMSSFANAWNIEARFLQGDYFQKKLDHLTDVQDQ